MLVLDNFQPAKWMPEHYLQQSTVYYYVYMLSNNMCMCIHTYTYIHKHYNTLHYNTLHYITIHYNTLHYNTLHYIHTYLRHTCTCVHFMCVSFSLIWQQLSLVPPLVATAGPFKTPPAARWWKKPLKYDKGHRANWPSVGTWDGNRSMVYKYLWITHF